MDKEEMISEIEIYLSHVVQKDFPLPKAIKMMYEEYKRQEDKEKAWEKIYSEDQNYITELNNKIFDLEEKNKKLEIEMTKNDLEKFITDFILKED
jgi:hypothetical protein